MFVCMCESDVIVSDRNLLNQYHRLISSVLPFRFCLPTELVTVARAKPYKRLRSSMPQNYRPPVYVYTEPF